MNRDGLDFARSLVEVFDVYGINIVMVAMTSGLVYVVKNICISAKLKIPSWVFMVFVLVSGFLVAFLSKPVFGGYRFGMIIESGIKNATVASFVYQAWDRVNAWIKGKSGDHPRRRASDG